MSDRSVTKGLRLASIASNPSTAIASPTTVIVDENSRTYSGAFTDAATAGTAVTNSPFATVKRAGTVKSINVAVPIAVTANDTTYATITVSKSIAGAAAVVLATHTTKITAGLGNLTAFAPYALTLSAVAGALNLLASDVLLVSVAKASTGVALTAATSTCSVSVDVEET